MRYFFIEKFQAKKKKNKTKEPPKNSSPMTKIRKMKTVTYKNTPEIIYTPSRRALESSFDTSNSSADASGFLSNVPTFKRRYYSRSVVL